MIAVSLEMSDEPKILYICAKIKKKYIKILNTLKNIDANQYPDE